MFDKTTILFCKWNTSTYYSDAPSILWKDKSLFYHKSLCLTWKVVSRRISNHYCGIKYTRWWGVWNDRKCVSDSAVVWLSLFHETEVKCFEYFSLQTVFALKDIFIFLTPWNEAMFWNLRYPENRRRKKITLFVDWHKLSIFYWNNITKKVEINISLDIFRIIIKHHFYFILAFIFLRTILYVFTFWWIWICLIALF